MNFAINTSSLPRTRLPDMGIDALGGTQAGAAETILAPEITTLQDDSIGDFFDEDPEPYEDCNAPRSRLEAESRIPSSSVERPAL